MTARIITIGDEILLGQIIDTNAAWIAEAVRAAGGDILGKETVGDDEEHMRAALARALEDADVVFLTGGLGPTRDDVTKKALAAHYGTGFVFSQETFDHIVRMFERFGRPVMDAHREQCFVPQNARLLPNKMGTAPGMWFDENDRVVVSMPGVPYEMKYLMEHEILPRLKKRFRPRPISYRTILTAGKGETQIAEIVRDFEDSLPDGMKLAYLPNLGRVRLRLTARTGNETSQRKLLVEKGDELVKLLGTDVYGEGKQTLSEALGDLLRTRKLQMGTAESCTGGFIAHQLTSVPGSSDYYEGTLVTYSNRLKMEILGVREETLAAHGAVSEEVVRQMLPGLLRVLQVDVGVAVSGIMGPSGGTPEKPVGTVWIGYGNADDVRAVRLTLGKNRLKNIEYTTNAALNLLRLFVQEVYPA